MSRYYQEVESYYDQDAADFEERYWKNPVLQRIRQDFREEVKRHTFDRILEIGYGTGLDMAHFAAVYPEVQVNGLDISSAMQRHAASKLSPYPLAKAWQGSVEDINITGGEPYDLIYVFFGALNTVEDLNLAAAHLHKALKPGGVLVLTFVNKWYLGGMLLELLKLRPARAFSRLRRIWGGYSPTRHLSSRCYSPKEIRKCFSAFRELKHQGYSILHPAWYYQNLNRRLGRLRSLLWDLDMKLNRTPAWKWGEYTLFVFQRPANGV